MNDGCDGIAGMTELLTGLMVATVVVGVSLVVNNGGKWLRVFVKRAKEAFHPSDAMNYRIFIPSIVLAVIVGALLHSWMGSRYRVFAAGNGVVMKVDEWTGQSWVRYSDYNSGAFYWQPVKESR
jgi:hypothetical protein